MNMTRCMNTWLATLLWVGGMTATASATTVYVAPDGNDNNPGTQKAPLQSLTAARDRLRADGATEDRRNVVRLAPGTYRLTETFELDERDSHTTYRADGAGVRIIGGREIATGAVQPVTDPDVLARVIAESARPHLRKINLKALGITEYGILGPRGFRRAYIPAPMELFIDGAPMQIARWPNAGEKHISMGPVVDPGSNPRYESDFSLRPGTFKYVVERPENWTQAKNFYISGIFNKSWADDTIPVAELDTEQGTFTTALPHLYSFHRASYTTWYALNLLEEIDQPGEYYVDKANGVLYFYPPAGFSADSRIEVSTLDDVMVAIEGATDVRFEDLIFEVSRGSAIYIERGADHAIHGCTLRNLGILAVQIGMGVEALPEGRHNAHGKLAPGVAVPDPISRKMGSWHEHIYEFTAFNRRAGTGHRVAGCDIYDTGAGGVSLGGGDRRTLTPGNNAVLNCDIYRVNRLDRAYKAPVNIDGVGNTVAHCHLHQSKGMGVYLHGNDHLIEFNEFNHLMLDLSDMGAIYMGRDPSEAGNIFRYNYFHHIRNYHRGGYGVQAIFFDDHSVCGAEVRGNIFRRTRPIKFNKGGAVDIVDNIFVDCPKPLIIGAPKSVRGFMLHSALGQKRLRERVDITKPPYSEKYPRLLAIYRGEPGVKIEVELTRPIVTTASDPRFVDGENGNFALKPNAEVPEGFKRPDFDKIGLYIGDGRDSLPVEPPRLKTDASPRFRGTTRITHLTMATAN